MAVWQQNCCILSKLFNTSSMLSEDPKSTIRDAAAKTRSIQENRKTNKVCVCVCVMIPICICRGNYETVFGSIWTMEDGQSTLASCESHANTKGPMEVWRSAIVFSGLSTIKGFCCRRTGFFFSPLKTGARVTCRTLLDASCWGRQQSFFLKDEGNYFKGNFPGSGINVGSSEPPKWLPTVAFRQMH